MYLLNTYYDSLCTPLSPLSLTPLLTDPSHSSLTPPHSSLTPPHSRAHYFSLPVQALECACAKIKPEGSQVRAHGLFFCCTSLHSGLPPSCQFWSTAATEYFRTMTERKAVVAFVKKGQGQVGNCIHTGVHNHWEPQVLCQAMCRKVAGQSISLLVIIF